MKDLLKATQWPSQWTETLGLPLLSRVLVRLPRPRGVMKQVHSGVAGKEQCQDCNLDTSFRPSATPRYFSTLTKS